MRVVISIASAIAVFLFSASAEAQPPCGKAGPCDAKPAPYGRPCPDKNDCYGKRRTVRTAQEASSIAIRYYAPKQVKVTAVEDRRFFFMVTVSEPDGRPVDMIAVDKRNGRIRSTY